MPNAGCFKQKQGVGDVPKAAYFRDISISRADNYDGAIAVQRACGINGAA